MPLYLPAPTTIAGVRELLQANRTYFVRTDGNNSNTGLVNSSGGAFLTIQKAVDVTHTLDLNGFTVTIQVVAGTYTTAVQLTQPWAGQGKVIIQGDTTTPTNVIINVTGDAISISNSCAVTIQGFKLQSTTTCLFVTNQAVLNLNSINFGASGSHMQLIQFAQIITTGDFTISGGGSSHVHNTNMSYLNIGTGTWTITGTPNFSTFFFGTSELSTSIFACTYSGSATGQRFFIHQGSLVQGGSGVTPDTFFPGSVTGNWNGMACFNEVYPVHQMSTNLAANIGTPSAAAGVVFIDSTSKALVNRDDAGTLHTTVASGTPGELFTITNVIGSDVTLNNTANYFTGPTCAQGTSGKWYASGHVTLVDTAGSAQFHVKLWDGTTVIAEGMHNTGAATGRVVVHLSGVITSPAGNIRISVKDASSTNGFITLNDVGNSKGAVLTVMRVG